MKDELNQQRETAIFDEANGSANPKPLEVCFHPLSFILHPSESGAAMVALLALLAILAIVLLGAAPSIYQQVLRAKELEAMHRGDEVAEAIRIYVTATGKLPTKIEDLLEGVQLPGRTKKIMILRESAARDPLSSSGEWKLVQPNDKVMGNFVREIKVFNNGVTPESPPVFQTNPRFQTVFSQIVSINNLETSEEKEPPGGEDDTDNVENEFIGVVSRAQTKSVMTFYGIERHDWWVFTPLFRGELNGGATGFGNGTGGRP